MYLFFGQGHNGFFSGPSGDVYIVRRSYYLNLKENNTKDLYRRITLLRPLQESVMDPGMCYE
jgi:hypothetical protein